MDLAEVHIAPHRIVDERRDCTWRTGRTPEHPSVTSLPGFTPSTWRESATSRRPTPASDVTAVAIDDALEAGMVGAGEAEVSLTIANARAPPPSAEAHRHDARQTRERCRRQPSARRIRPSRAAARHPELGLDEPSDGVRNEPDHQDRDGELMPKIDAAARTDGASRSAGPCGGAKPARYPRRFQRRAVVARRPRPYRPQAAPYRPPRTAENALVSAAISVCGPSHHRQRRPEP